MSSQGSSLRLPRLSRWPAVEDQAARLAQQLRGLRWDPLLLSFALSTALFLPLAVLGNYDLVDGSVFQRDSSSYENTTVLYVGLGMAFPLLVDLCLDLFSYQEASYMGVRLLSLCSTVLSATTSLAFDRSNVAGAVTQAVYSWGYFVEMSVITCFMHYLCPAHFPRLAVLTLNGILFAAFLVFNLNSISLFHDEALFVLFFLLLYLFAALFLALCGRWMSSLITDFRSQRKPLRKWLEGLSSSQVCTLVLMAAILFVYAVFTVALAYLCRDFPNAYSIDLRTRDLIQLSRSFLCTFTYILPTRLFRGVLLAAQADLNMQTEFVKYISHEIRTPASVVMTGLELMEEELEEENCDHELLAATANDLKGTMVSRVEILDDLLLYEKLERNDMNLNISAEEPSEFFRAMMEGFETDVMLPASQNNSRFFQRMRISVDRQKMKIAFNAILKAVVKDKGDGGVKAVLKIGAISESPLHRGASIKARRQIAPGALNQTDTVVIAITGKKNGKKLEDVKYLSEDEALRFKRVGHEDGGKKLLADFYLLYCSF